jgi:hypothetical protein
MRLVRSVSDRATAAFVRESDVLSISQLNVLGELSFADRLVDQHLAGKVGLRELLENDIDPFNITMLVTRIEHAGRRHPLLAASVKAAVDRLDDLRLALSHFAKHISDDPSCYMPHVDEALAIATERMYEAMLQTGGCFTRVTLPIPVRCLHPKLLRRKIEDRDLLAIRCGDQPARFPALQFSAEGRIIPGIGRVADALGEREVAHIVNFLAYPSEDLDGEAPLSLLADGDIGPVLAAARTAVFV